MRHESWASSPFKGKTTKHENDSSYGYIRTKRFFGKEFQLKRGFGPIEEQFAESEMFERELELLGDFGINVAPHSNLIMAIPDGDKEVPTLVAATKIIKGRPFQEAPGKERLDVFKALNKYYLSKIGEVSPFLGDVFAPYQYVYGSVGREAPNIYLLYPGRNVWDGLIGIPRHVMIDYIMNYESMDLQHAVRSA